MQQDSQPTGFAAKSLLQSQLLSNEAWENRNDNRSLCREQSLEALTLAGADPLARAFALRSLSYVDYLESNFVPALEAAQIALEIAEQHDHLLLQRDLFNTFGGVHYRLGELNSALEYAQKTFQINLALQDQPATVHSLNNFALLHGEVGDHTSALRLLEDALERARQMADAPLMALVLSNLGDCLTLLGRTVEAIPLLREALRLTEEHDLTNLEARCLCNLAEALTTTERLDEALEVYLQALESVALHGPPEGEFHCQLGQANIHLMRQQPATARTDATAALRTAEHLGVLELQMQAHATLCKIHKALGDFEAALHHFEQQHQLAQQMRASVTEHRLQAVTARFEIDRARAETEIAHLRNVELAKAVYELELVNMEKTELLEQLERKSQELQALAFRDVLTGLANRRYLEDALRTEFEKASQKERPLSLALMDVDDFKRINDEFSHRVGDAVLAQIAALISKGLRGFDLAARYGGEEFVVLLPRTSSEQALRVCERLRLIVSDYDWSGIQEGLKVTLSIGVATNIGCATPEKLLEVADVKMYAAKSRGKNCVCIE